MGRDTITWSVLGVLIGVLGSAVGGSWYVSSAIAEEGRRARAEAQALVEDSRARNSELYARREDLLVLQVKLDAMLKMQEEILQRLRQHEP